MNIFSAPILKNHPLGTKDYLDMPISPTAPVMQGQDELGRHFLVVCAKRTDEKGDAEYGVFTAFQRHMAFPDVWVLANNHARIAPPCRGLQGELSHEDILAIYELAEEGKATFKFNDGPIEKTWKYERVDPSLAIGGYKVRTVRG